VTSPATYQELEQLAVFRVDDGRYALPLATVARIVRAVETTPLPRAPATVVGVIDVHGEVLPVLNLRRKLQLAEREITPSDHFLIARTERRTLVLVIDRPEAVIEVPAVEIVNTNAIESCPEQFRGIVKLPDGLVLIHDLEKFLSLEEELALNDALSEEADDVDA
jgi:purine-binding chemotaxis protein CheW